VTKFADKFGIETSRLKSWNYSTPGIYFITICTLNHNNFFGKIIDGQILYKQCGEITKNELLKTFEIRKNLKLIDWVVMPNHVHVLFSVGDCQVETPGLASLQDDSKQISVISSHKNHPMFFNNMGIKSKKNVSAMIQQFKGAVKRKANKENLFFAWQTGYFDEIVSDNKRLEIIIKYIKNNSKNWEKDKLFL
jgi:putative transposase